MPLHESDLTIGDLEDFEEAAGVSFEKAFKNRTPVLDEDGNNVLDEKGKPITEVEVTPKIMKAMCWIVRRHDDPDFTLEDARKVRIGDLDELLDFGTKPDPTGAAG